MSGVIEVLVVVVGNVYGCEKFWGFEIGVVYDGIYLMVLVIVGDYVVSVDMFDVVGD